MLCHYNNCGRYEEAFSPSGQETEGGSSESAIPLSPLYHAALHTAPSTYLGRGWERTLPLGSDRQGRTSYLPPSLLSSLSLCLSWNRVSDYNPSIERRTAKTAIDLRKKERKKKRRNNENNEEGKRVISSHLSLHITFIHNPIPFHHLHSI